MIDTAVTGERRPVDGKAPTMVPAVNFVDSTLVKLADPTTRGGIFDNDSLGQLVATAYEADSMGVQGPYQPVFDRFDLALATPALGALEGSWNAVAENRTEAQFRIAGVGSSPPRIDAFWRGAIVARYAVAGEKVTAVKVRWPDPGTIDAEIIAALGALPADPVALEQERRKRFLARIRAGLDQPAAFTDDRLTKWLDAAGATSVGDLMSRFDGTVADGTVSVTYDLPASVSDTPKALPVAIALMIREAGFSLSQLMAETRVARDRIGPLGLEVPHGDGLRPRQPVLIAWIIPSSIFDDADWPGGAAGMTADQLRSARRSAAGTWLAREGIGLIVTAPHP